MKGLPPQVTVHPDHRETVEMYIYVPEEVENGDYQFTIAAESSQRYALTSTIRVVEGFKWPTINWTGMFGFIGIAWWWVPLLLLALILLILLIYFLIWLLSGSRIRRRRVAERNVRRSSGEEGPIRNFFKFDDCC
jgi:hypothetical protein